MPRSGCFCFRKLVIFTKGVATIGCSHHCTTCNHLNTNSRMLKQRLLLLCFVCTYIFSKKLESNLNNGIYLKSKLSKMLYS